MSDVRSAVVTGASGGIGLETSRELARRDYHVVLLCRNPQKADDARVEIESTVPEASLDIVLADLSRMDQVRAAATEIEQRLERLDVLVNNAAVQARRRTSTPEGLDLLLATNHLGPFLLTNLLLPLLRKSAPSRIVNVASEAHKFGKLRLDDLQATRGYGPLGMRRYGETKLMNILFTRELARRLDGTGVTVNAVHPGSVATNLGNPPKIIAGLSSRFLRTPAQGAVTSVVVATDPSLEGVTGGYFMNGKQADNKLNRQARDDELARALWERSEQLTGTTDESSPPPSS
jgi:NAD(P)-dependent dehydrogenase (short-subunit alcohol dehydrogenase family)